MNETLEALKNTLQTTNVSSPKESRVLVSQFTYFCSILDY